MRLAIAVRASRPSQSPRLDSPSPTHNRRNAGTRRTGPSSSIEPVEITSAARRGLDKLDHPLALLRSRLLGSGLLGRRPLGGRLLGRRLLRRGLLGTALLGRGAL